MRGKSIDTEFVAEFIQNCTVVDKISPDEICEEALRKIEEIDKQLKLRLKLADVLSFFNYKKKAPITEREAVSFDSIGNDASSEIMNIIVNSGCISTEDLMIKINSHNDEHKKDLIFTLKQLLETKILYRTSTGLLAHGQNYKLFNETKS